MTDNKPRAYTEDEVRDMILAHIRTMVAYWADLPDRDPATGRELTVRDRCDGVAFSILTMLDGCSMNIPAITLKLEPHESDMEFNKGEGVNWFAPGMEIATMLHDFYYKG